MKRLLGRTRHRSVAVLVCAVAVTGVAAGVAVADTRSEGPEAPRASGGELVVAAFEVEPFVERRGDVPGGFMFEVWEQVAAEAGWDYDVVWIESLGDLAELVEDGGADVAVAPLSSTRGREEGFDFTTPVAASGPTFGVHQRAENPVSLAAALISVDILGLLGWSALGLLVLAHLMWLVERRRPQSDFAEDYATGVLDGVWWALVTVTTVGYGDKAPRTGRGRAVATLAMMGSLFLVGAFVSEVTAALQFQRAGQVITDVGDLDGRPVAVVHGSSYQTYLDERGVTTIGYPRQPDVLAAAAAGDVDVVVADRYTLAAVGDDYGLRGTDELLYDEFIAFGVRQDSPLRDEINRALADLHQRGLIREIAERWTG